MRLPVFAIFKNEEKESDYPGFAQACAVWSDDPIGKKVVKVGANGNVLEEFTPEECEAETSAFRKRQPEK